MNNVSTNGTDSTSSAVSERCFECGQPAEFDHHVVPRSRGGINTVPLCRECHAKAHHRNGNMGLATLRGDQSKATPPSSYRLPIETIQKIDEIGKCQGGLSNTRVIVWAIDQFHGPEQHEVPSHQTKGVKRPVRSMMLYRFPATTLRQIVEIAERQGGLTCTRVIEAAVDYLHDVVIGN